MPNSKLFVLVVGTNWWPNIDYELGVDIFTCRILIVIACAWIK